MINLKKLIIMTLVTTSIFAASSTITFANTNIEEELYRQADSLIPSEEELYKLRLEDQKKTEEIMSAGRAYPTSKILRIGTAKQNTPYYCGPATLYNAVYGYDVANYGYYCTTASDGRLLNQQDYAGRLGTSTAGTAFGQKFVDALNRYLPYNNYTLKWGESTNWETTVKNSILWTINKDNGYKKKNYPVIVNQYKSSNVSGAIHPVYNNKSSAHFYNVYGYSNNANTYHISDSNTAMKESTYTSPQYYVARDCQQRGIIW